MKSLEMGEVVILMNFHLIKVWKEKKYLIKRVSVYWRWGKKKKLFHQFLKLFELLMIFFTGYSRLFKSLL
jgi:hypothetical protein